MNSATRGNEPDAGTYEGCIPPKKRKELGVAALRSVSQSVYYTQQEWQLVYEAAALEGISRSEFVAIAAVKRAQEILRLHRVQCISAGHAQDEHAEHVANADD